MNDWTERERRLLAITVLCCVIVVVDVIAVNVAGELPSTWWLLAVPVGFVAVPVLGMITVGKLINERRHP